MIKPVDPAVKRTGNILTFVELGMLARVTMIVGRDTSIRDEDQFKAAIKRELQRFNAQPLLDKFDQVWDNFKEYTQRKETH